ncbi:hypothetical protein SAMN02745126_03212 [Enhydrobacter aerosaccus]|uniref:Uncharacterized protein n=1 Tax=Enhydrobacter aerosaccus TaxID=225324 RepID=A0A1T4QGH9_9HYPH|nr:hypothetical protein [Enhydrobacter aerosaccus]SKA02802.1 hypothetical protein SAMN02745126_03212 [Enhydrobacter aerosaccus]
MSYDLYLKPRSGTITEGQMLDYFRAQPNYTIESGQAFYENQSTGVYFWFDKHEAEPDSPDSSYAVAFGVNFFRPSFFIYEAELEVAAFVREFDCVVLDPQSHGMGEGEYRRNELISGWNHGNEIAYRSVLTRQSQSGKRPSALPAEQLTRIWNWNYCRPILQHEQTRDLFVPAIIFILIDGRLATMAVWPDCIPAILPKVDYLLIEREKFAPRRLFSKAIDMVYLPWNEALPDLGRHSSPHEGEAVSLNYDDQPADVVAFVSSLVPRSHTVSGVAMAEVLDRELVEKVLYTS